MTEKINSDGLAEQPTGYIIGKKSPHKQTEVSMTDENNHLFVFNKDRQKFELVYQGSQIILDLLILFQENKKFDRNAFRNTYPLEKHLALFDVYGNFHNFVLLKALKFDHHGEGESRSDTAYFWELNRATDEYDKLAISIPEIYCISLAQHPVIWEGNGNN